MRSLGRGGWIAVLAAIVIVAALVAGVLVAFQRGLLRAPDVLSSRLGTPTSRPGSSYREAAVGTPTMLNPLLATSRVDRDLSALIFSGLTRTAANGTVVPDLASSWKVEDDGKRYTFTLRDGVRWHDGQPFTANDVLLTIRLLQDPAFPGDPATADFWRTVNVETPDQRTVICTLPRTYAPFLTYTNVGILPASKLAAVKAGDLANDPFNLQPVGTGPFAFAALDTSNVSVTLKRFDQYYGTKPQLAELHFRSYTSTSAALQAVAQGEADGISYIPPSALESAGSIAPVANIYGPSIAGYTALFFNLKTPQLTVPEVRQALALAVNRDELVREGLHGWGTPGDSPILPSSWAYAQQQWPQNPQKAQILLDGAGWKMNAAGVREKDGQLLAFTLLIDNDPLRASVAQVLVQEYANIGIQLKVAAKSPQELAQMLATRHYDLALSGWEGLAGDPDPYQGWHSSQAETGYNFAGWANAAADKALEDGRLTTDEAKRKAAYADFQRIFATEIPSLILYYPQYHYAVSKKFSGPNADTLNTPSDRFRTIATWQVQP